MTDLDQKPRLRFKGFTEAWEQRKLGDIASIVGGGTPSTINNDYWGGSINWFSPIEIGNEIYVGSSQNKITKEGYDNCSAKLLPVGTILFTSRAGIGKTAILTVKGCTNQGFQSIVPNIDKLDSYFIYSRSDELKKYGEAMGAGSTFVEVSGKQMAEMKLMMPSTLKEQQVIGNFFKNLDNLITLHQRKYEKLKSMKTALLEKMFPAGNDTSPKIRFKGFTEAWEQRKLGDIASIVGGGTPSTINNDYWGGSINWFSPIEIGNEIYVGSSQNKITKEGYDNCSAKLLPVGTILFTSRAGIGKTAILTVKGCTNQGFQSIVPNIDKLDSYFIYSRSDELKKYGEAMGAGSTFVEVSGKQMAEMKLMMPSTLKEQQVIGNFFKNLDNLITLHQRKCEKLKNLKKSLLERMFI